MRIFVCCISSAARTCILYFFHSTNQRYSKWLSNLHHMNEMLELFTSTFLCSASPNKWVLQRMHNAVCVCVCVLFFVNLYARTAFFRLCMHTNSISPMITQFFFFVLFPMVFFSCCMCE